MSAVPDGFTVWGARIWKSSGAMRRCTHVTKAHLAPYEYRGQPTEALCGFSITHNPQAERSTRLSVEFDLDNGERSLCKLCLQLSAYEKLGDAR